MVYYTRQSVTNYITCFGNPTFSLQNVQQGLHDWGLTNSSKLIPIIVSWIGLATILTFSYIFRRVRDRLGKERIEKNVLIYCINIYFCCNFLQLVKVLLLNKIIKSDPQLIFLISLV